MKQTQRCKSKHKRGDTKMKSKQNLMMFGLVLAGVIALLMPSQVMAAGTASGTNITNSATLDYQVLGVDQTQINSNTTTFVVDNKVDLTVAEVSSANVVPGSNNQVLVFSVTNTGNTTQGYSLLTTDGADDFDMNNVRIYLDVNNDGLLDGGDTLYTLGTNIADIAADGSIQVLVVADTPLTPTNGETAVYNLIATTLDAGTTTITANDSGDADDPNVVQVVWADGAGTDDAATDGTHSADAIYSVASADLAVTKTQAVESDPINGTTNPKAIPGATVRYTITVVNSGAEDATSVVLVDTTPVNTTYVPGSITLDTVSKTDINDGDEADHGASNAGAVTVPIATLASGGGTATITFDVVID
jgi:uncharacterized repeat protein (TIGR01451 family)